MNPKLTKVQQRVLRLYNEDRSVVDQDARLIDRYWHTYDGADDEKSLYWNLTKCTPPGTITRARRKLHEYGLVIYKKEVLANREKLYLEHRNENSSYNPAVYVGLDTKK